MDRPGGVALRGPTAPTGRPVRGITTVGLADQADARAAGRIIRLLATAELGDDGDLTAAVLPTALPLSSPLGRTAGVLAGSRSTPCRSAGSSSTVRVPVAPPPRRPCSGIVAIARRRVDTGTCSAAGADRIDMIAAGAQRIGGPSGIRYPIDDVKPDGEQPGARPAPRRPLPGVPAVTDATPALTLDEEFTPLVRARRLGSALGLEKELYLKVEGPEPDRLVQGPWDGRGHGQGGRGTGQGHRLRLDRQHLGVGGGLRRGGHRKVIVVLPKGQIAIGKLLQALVAGARVVAIDSNFDQALGIVRALHEQDDHPVTLVNSINRSRLDGQKTAAFEICDDLGRAPDVLAIPVGNAGNIGAYWAGFRDYADAGIVERTPRL